MSGERHQFFCMSLTLELNARHRGHEAHVDRAVVVVSNAAPSVDPNFVNPYQPPSPGVGYVMDLGSPPTELNLADVGTRFIGALVDGLVYVPVMIPAVIIQVLIGGDGDLTPLVLIAILVGFLGLSAFQWYLIATTGQSIAKRILRIRIVRLNGSPVNFMHGVILRSWVMAFLTNIPLVGFIVGIVDGAMIFGHERRCLHDRLADTTVIKV